MVSLQYERKLCFDSHVDPENNQLKMINPSKGPRKRNFTQVLPFEGLLLNYPIFSKRFL